MLVLTKFAISELATQYSPRKCRSEYPSNNPNFFAISREFPPEQLITNFAVNDELSENIILVSSDDSET